MKRAAFSSVRDPARRSRKRCCCGGHGHKDKRSHGRETIRGKKAPGPPCRQVVRVDRFGGSVFERLSCGHTLRWRDPREHVPSDERICYRCPSDGPHVVGGAAEV